MFFKKSVKSIVYIDGMSCGHCAARVEKLFSDLGYKAKVDIEKKLVSVKSDIALNEAEIFDAILSIGFNPKRIETK